MLHDHEYICPICGLIYESLTAYHKHANKDHKNLKETGEQE